MIVAIDPGSAGGIVALKNTGEITARKMPETDMDIVEYFEGLLSVNYPGEKCVCYMEKVGGFVGMRTNFISCPKCRSSIPVKAGDPGSAMFKFGFGNGLLTGIILAKRIRLELVTPHSWQKVLGLGTKSGMSKTEWKNKLKAMAQRLYPEMRVTLNTADALLILEYAKIMIRNQL